MSNQQYDLIDSIQNFEANFYEAIPGSHFYSPDDIPLLLDAYQRSEYIDADTRFVIIQVYFKYEQGRHYIGIGQEVYEVKGPNSVFFRSIDSSVFQPNLLDNQASKPSYVIYGIALFCIMLGCLFFLVLNVGLLFIIRSFGFANCVELLQTVWGVSQKFGARFGQYSTRQWWFCCAHSTSQIFLLLLCITVIQSKIRMRYVYSLTLGFDWVEFQLPGHLFLHFHGCSGNIPFHLQVLQTLF